MVMMGTRLASHSDSGRENKLTGTHSTTLIDTGADYMDSKMGLVCWAALRLDLQHSDAARPLLNGY
jgi:hypothetical protein